MPTLTKFEAKRQQQQVQPPTEDPIEETGSPVASITTMQLPVSSSDGALDSEDTATKAKAAQDQNQKTARSNQKHTAIPAWTMPIVTAVVCLILLSSIVAPCVVGAQIAAQRGRVKSNMRTVQIAAESYATDNEGRYPSRLSQLLPYLPGGSNQTGGREGRLLENPILGQSVVGVVDGRELSSSKDISALRTQPAARSYLMPGQVAYCALPSRTSYAVIAADQNNLDIAGIGGNKLVLSNQ